MRVVFEPTSETADEWLIREAPGFAPYWLVTSDRELRELAGGGAERVIGGGSFAATCSNDGDRHALDGVVGVAAQVP